MMKNFAFLFAFLGMVSSLYASNLESRANDPSASTRLEIKEQEDRAQEQWREKKRIDKGLEEKRAEQIREEQKRADEKSRD